MAAVSPFTAVKPVAINSANLVSNNASDATAAYNAGTDYPIAAVVQLNGRRYESTDNPNQGNDPEAEGSLFWLDIGPTNDMAAFDSDVSTPTSASSPWVFSFTGEQFDSIAFLDCEATTIRVQVTSPVAGGEYFDQTFTLKDKAIVTNWYEYFTAPILKEKDKIFLMIPAYTQSTYTVTVSGPPDPVSVGQVIAGKKLQFGFSEYDAEIQARGRTRRVVSSGAASLTQSNFARRMTVRVVVQNNSMDSVLRTMQELDEEMVLYIAANGLFESLTMLGKHQQFRTTVPNPGFTRAYFDILGLY